ITLNALTIDPQSGIINNDNVIEYLKNNNNKKSEFIADLAIATNIEILDKKHVDNFIKNFGTISKSEIGVKELLDNNLKKENIYQKSSEQKVKETIENINKNTNITDKIFEYIYDESKAGSPETSKNLERLAEFLEKLPKETSSYLLNLTNEFSKDMMFRIFDENFENFLEKISENSNGGIVYLSGIENILKGDIKEIKGDKTITLNALTIDPQSGIINNDNVIEYLKEGNNYLRAAFIIGLATKVNNEAGLDKKDVDDFIKKFDNEIIKNMSNNK
ncbi:MAG: hypothetical protein ACP5T6_01395, partial [Candidatus Micrarchaeia archaeon]